MTRARVFLVATVTLAVGASGNLHGDDLFLDRINTDLVEHEPIVQRVKTATTARRFVVVFVDGLRDDVAFGLENVRALEARGVAQRMDATFPSFTYPAVATFATGVEPIHSGVRLNWGGHDPPLDSVSKRADAEGWRVRVAPAEFAPFKRLLFLPPSAEIVDVETAVTSTTPHTLTWIYFGAVDHAGHRYGADSDEYRAAARDANAFVGRVVTTLDLERDAVFVLSDHGHLDGGGHGGVEVDARRGFFAAAGAGVAHAGRLAPGDVQVFVAPSIAAIIGAELPHHAHVGPSRHWLGALVDDAEASRANEARRAERDRHFRADIDAVTAAAKRAGITLIVALLAAGIASWRARIRSRDFLPVIVHAVVFVALYFAVGYRWSWTVPRGYAAFLLETAAFAAIGIVLALLVARRARRVEEALACAIVHGVPYVVLAAWVGLDRRWMPSPDASWGVVLLATLQFYVCPVFGARALTAFRGG